MLNLGQTGESYSLIYVVFSGLFGFASWIACGRADSSSDQPSAGHDNNDPMIHQASEAHLDPRIIFKSAAVRARLSGDADRTSRGRSIGSPPVNHAISGCSSSVNEATNCR
jgi:hypothetical protein